MATVQAYDSNLDWLSNVNHDNNIDYFFTQRKVVEYDEFIDEKTLERKKKKRTTMYNFLAINFPNNQFTNKKK